GIVDGARRGHQGARADGEAIENDKAQKKLDPHDSPGTVARRPSLVKFQDPGNAAVLWRVGALRARIGSHGSGFRDRSSRRPEAGPQPRRGGGACAVVVRAGGDLAGRRSGVRPGEGGRRPARAPGGRGGPGRRNRPRPAPALGGAQGKKAADQPEPPEVEPARAAETDPDEGLDPLPVPPVTKRSFQEHPAKVAWVFDGKGEPRKMSIGQAEARGYTVVDLSNTWIPSIFTEKTPGQDDYQANQFRETYIGLANDRIDSYGDPLEPHARNFLELYGIPPTLAVI